MENRSLILMDETLREGMQYRGVMFSLKQRLEILDFQEQLGVDICQAGYPSAHKEEAKILAALVDHARKNHYRIRMAAMGRAIKEDAAVMINAGVSEMNLHLHIAPGTRPDVLDNTLKNLADLQAFVQQQAPDAGLCIVMLDIGRSDARTLEQAVRFCSRQKIELLSLPDTSGMMSPFQVFQTISKLSAIAGQTRLSIHCHNDMGMASANTIMGIEAGGSVAEVSVLGIGERNGIADLFTTARMLQSSGFDIQLNTQDLATFHAYYKYIDTIVYQQLGTHLLHASTPFFGQAVKTHVAGTHAGGQFGMASKEHYYLNSLCGRHLVKKYLTRHKIDCPDSLLEKLTDEIKAESLRLNRSLTPADIKKIIVLLGNSG